MRTGTRSCPATAGLSGTALALALRIARSLGISLEIAGGPTSRRAPLHLAPDCSSCRLSEPRTFDRCRKRRSYLSRRAVPVPLQLAEKCPLGMRLARRGAGENETAPTLFAFGLPGGDLPEEKDMALHAFLAALSALMAPSAMASPASARAPALRCLRAAGDDLPALGSGDDEDSASGAPGMVAWRTDLVVDLVASLEARKSGLRGHALRVRVLARLLGEELGLAAQDLAALEWAAQLHDVAAVGVLAAACKHTARGGEKALLQFLPFVLKDELQPQGLSGACLQLADSLETRIAAAAGPLRARLRASLADFTAADDSEPQLVAALGRIEPLLAEHLWIFLLQR